MYYYRKLLATGRPNPHHFLALLELALSAKDFDACKILLEEVTKRFAESPEIINTSLVRCIMGAVKMRNFSATKEFIEVMKERQALNIGHIIDFINEAVPDQAKQLVDSTRDYFKVLLFYISSY